MFNTVNLSPSTLALNNVAVCGSCGKNNAELFKCIFCQHVWYCNRVCQERHWPAHKKTCVLFKGGGSEGWVADSKEAAQSVEKEEEGPELIREMVKGGEGVVYLAKWQNGQEVVVKAPLNPNEGNLSLAIELYVFTNTAHPHVLGHVGQIPSKQWLLLPYMERGSLDSALFPPKEPCPWFWRMQISCQIADAVQYLHGKGILHCDIKSANILLDDKCQAKLADFGTVLIKDRPELRREGSTPSYQSPELSKWMQRHLHLSSRQTLPQDAQGDVPPFSESSDVYAMGTVFWEIAERKPALAAVLGGCFRLSQETPLTYGTCIQQCRAVKPENRPTAAVIFQELSHQDFKEKVLRQANPALIFCDFASQGELAPSNPFERVAKLLFLDAKCPQEDLLAENQILLQGRLKDLEKRFSLFQEATCELSKEALRLWELDCHCLLQKNYWTQISSSQQKMLQQLTLKYGYWVQNSGRDLSLWPLIEGYILNQGFSHWGKPAAQRFLIGLAEMRICGPFEHPVSETIAFIHRAREIGKCSVVDERLNYTETLLALSLLWQTLRQTLAKQSRCQFHDMVEQWFEMLKEIKEQFARSTDPFIQSSLTMLVQDSCQCVNPLIPYRHKRWIFLLNEAKQVGPHQVAQILDADLLEGYKKDRVFQRWDWIAKMHADVLQPAIEPYLEEAGQKGLEAYEQAVAKWVEPWVKLYREETHLFDLATSFVNWVKLFGSEGKKKVCFDSIAFEGRIEHHKKERTALIGIQPPAKKNRIQSLWNTLKREKGYQNPEEYTQHVIQALDKALKLFLPFLGEAPKNAGWALLGLGSLGRKQLLPYSDLDIALLVDDPSVRTSPYWKRLIDLLEALTQIMDGAGHWDAAESKYVFLGHHIDPGDKNAMQGSDEKEPVLIQTPKGLAGWVVEALHGTAKHQETTRILAYSCLHTINIAGTGVDLWAQYTQELNKALEDKKKEHSCMALEWQQEHAKGWQRSLRDDLEVKKNYINLKDSVFAPLNYYWLDNGLLHLLKNENSILITGIDRLKNALQENQKGRFAYWLMVMQSAWKEAFKLRWQIELTAKGRVSLVARGGAERQTGFVKLTPAEKSVVLTKAELLLIERLQGVTAVAYNALLQSQGSTDPLQTDKEGICLAQIHPSLQDHWVAGAAAALTFGKRQDAKAHRKLYRLMPPRMRLEYEHALKCYSHAGVAPTAEWLLKHILPSVPLPNGNRGSFLERQKLWQATVKSLAAPCIDLGHIPKRATGALMSWVEDNRICHGILKEEFAKQLLDKAGQFRKEEKLLDGRSPVIPLVNDKERIIVYPKAYPEFPGRQLAADCLNYRLTGSAVQSSLVLFTPLNNGQLGEAGAYPVLLSKPAGQTIQDYVCENSSALEKTPLDSYHFTLKVLSTYIIGYEDDKKDNVTLVKTRDPWGKPCWQLLSVDTDHAFCPPMSDDTAGAKVQLKTVTFAFSAMGQPLDPEAVADFLSLNKYQVLEEWLGQCRALQSGLIGNLTLKPQRHGLFNPAVLKRVNSSCNWFASSQSSYIPIAFEPGTIVDIYQRWMRVEAAIKKGVLQTHFDLLDEVCPRLARCYRYVFPHQTVAERFNAFAKLYTDYSTTTAGHYISHTSKYKPNISKTLVGVKRFQDVLENRGSLFDAGRACGLKELDVVQEHYQHLIELKKVCQVGIGSQINQQHAVIETLERLMGRPYYAALIERVLASIKFVYTDKNTEQLIAFQDRLLNLLSGRSLHDINFVNWRALTEDQLLKVIKKSGDLRSLTVIDCPNFVCSAAGWAELSLRCPELREIHLSQVEQLPLSWIDNQISASNLKTLFMFSEITAAYPALESLHLENCPHLVSYQMRAPCLRELTLSNCPKLELLDLSSQPIAILRLQRCQQLADQGICHDSQGQHLRTLSLSDCPNIQFAQVYQKWPFLLGLLGSFYTDENMEKLIQSVEALKLKPHEINTAARFFTDQCVQWRQCSIALAKQIPLIQKALLRGLEDKESPVVQESCANSLGVLYLILPKGGQKQIVESVFKGIKDPHWKIRAAYMGSLTTLYPLLSVEGQAEALKAAHEGMSDPFSWTVPVASAKLLARIFSENLPNQQKQAIFEAVVQGLKSRDKNFRASCAKVLSGFDLKLKEKAIEAVFAAVSDEHWEVQSLCVQILAGLSSLPLLKQQKALEVILETHGNRNPADINAYISMGLACIKAIEGLYSSLSTAQQQEILSIVLKGAER